MDNVLSNLVTSVVVTTLAGVDIVVLEVLDDLHAQGLVLLVKSRDFVLGEALGHELVLQLLEELFGIGLASVLGQQSSLRWKDVLFK
jgi:hypothetical protein